MIIKEPQIVQMRAKGTCANLRNLWLFFDGEGGYAICSLDLWDRLVDKSG